MALGCGYIIFVSFAAWPPIIHVFVVHYTDIVGHWCCFSLARSNMAVAGGL